VRGDAGSGLERAIELVLSIGLGVSGALLLAGLLAGSDGLLKWALLLLMLTPVARVVVLTVGLLHERDWLFGLISLWILGVLASSMAVAAH